MLRRRSSRLICYTPKQMKKIGIYAGTFDPVHKAHVAFALAAAKDARLDEVYFLPEVAPRYKNNVSHIAHRTAMLRLACRAHSQLKILELPDKAFSCARTWPKLRRRWPEDELFLLVGSDVVAHMGRWTGVEQMLPQMGLVVAVRGTSQTADLQLHVASLPAAPKNLKVIDSPEPAISSRAIRHHLRAGGKTDSLLPSVSNYISGQWLYQRIP